MPGGLLLAPADYGDDLVPGRAEGDVHRGQGPGRRAPPLVQQAYQEVLGADVVVVEHACFLLGEDHDAPRLVGEPLEHDRLRFRPGPRRWTPDPSGRRIRPL